MLPKAFDIYLAAAAKLVEATTNVLKGYRTESIWWDDSSSIASSNDIDKGGLLHI